MYLAKKIAKDGSLVCVVPLITGTARITISYPSPWMDTCVDDSW